MALFNQSRSFVVRLIIGIVFLIIVAQLFNLQVVSSKYKQLAMSNAVFPKVKYPDRGIIYDRNKQPILNNTIMYDLVVTPYEVKNIDTQALCNLLDIDTAEFRIRMRDARFKNGPSRPSIFEDLLPPLLQVRLNENIWKFPGFALVERPVRTYPYNAAAHILGYVGEVSQREIDRSGNFYRMGDYVGKSGLEAAYERVLMGQRGVQYMIKDNRNRLVGSYEKGIYDTLPIAGHNLHTSIDIDLQMLAEKLLQHKVGAVVALDPHTGGIIAMASGPNFNPNDLTGPDKQKNYSTLVLDVAGPLLNRAIQGNYEPGSTFKPVGALVALDEGVITPAYGYPCRGRYMACGHGKPACTHNAPGHAANLRLAIANSCNSYFAHVYRLTVDNPKYKDVEDGYEVWKDYLNHFGLGERLGVDLPSESSGLVPDTSRYNRIYRNAWNSCTNLTLGIGQDMMQATPLQIANAISIIANKGYYYVPHFVTGIDDYPGETELLKAYRQKHEVLTKIPNADYETVISGMQDVVDFGTASNARLPGIAVCGKTGTAQKFRYIDGQKVQLKDNSVFVAFAPRENPKIAIAVVVENSGAGNTWAAPIAGILMEKYINDTLRTERLKQVDEIAAANLMPPYLERLQFIEDSTRAEKWLEAYGDSSFIKKYLHIKGQHIVPRKQEPRPTKEIVMRAEASLPDRRHTSALTLKSERR